MNLKERAKQLQATIPAIFFALKDNSTPIIAKIFAGITVVYAFSPIDLIPDFIPLIGYLDDLILLPILVALTIKFIPEDILEKNRQLAEEMWKNFNYKKWYYAIPILIVWIFIIGLILKAVIKK